MLEHLDDDVEVGPIHRVLVPALLHQGAVLEWAVLGNLTHIRPCLLLEHRCHDFMRSEVSKRWLSSHDLPHDDAVGVHVGLVTVISVALEHLGCHPVESTRQASHLRGRPLLRRCVEVLDRSRKTEICHLALYVVRG